MSADEPSAHPSRRANRLAAETSPYLLQHALNPVDWRPWGHEAFAEARRRDVPIFLSIGYSTCYWCHVMERESFESEDIARVLNERFVSVKVDREERPDLDDLYMTAVQVFTGHGGWPMSVFLEPFSLKPFWAGTYFPPEPRYPGMPSFPQVLERLSDAWASQRDEVLGQADGLADAVRERLAAAHEPVRIGQEQVIAAVEAVLRMFDRNHGGFGGAPKFPQPCFIELLLDARVASADDATRQAIDAAVRTTLDRMACGGIHDHLAGGFHRYSVDARWLVPHFEKMLYDNAQLALVYARAASVYDDPFYRRTARRTLEYVLDEMTDPASGLFFSAQDAEVDGREGANYLWTTGQFRAEASLSSDDAAFAESVYGLDAGPNFRDPHHPGAMPANVLRLAERPDRLAAAWGLEERAFLERLDRISSRLLAARRARRQPRLDDKSIAAWNGMMIRAMAVGGVLLDETRLVGAAARAADSLLETMRESRTGGLLRSARRGEAHVAGFLEDYAFVIRGLVALHQAGAEPGSRFLRAACELVAEAIRRFGAPDGGFFDTMDGQSDLFVRARSSHDGAAPSGAGEMIHALLDVADAAGDTGLRARAAAALVAVSADVARAPAAVGNSVRALMRMLATAPAQLDAAFAASGAADHQASPGEDRSPVEILATTDRISVSRAKPGGLVARVRIAGGYHLIAADPSPGRDSAGLVPFRVGLTGAGAEPGLRVFADYPEGEPDGVNGELRVYRRSFDLTILVEQTGPVAGQPLVTLTFQACTGDRCLAPRTLRLDVTIDHE